MLIENRTLQLSIVIFKSVQAMGRSGEYLLYASMQEQFGVLTGKLREYFTRP
jgi:hypothetical protein